MISVPIQEITFELKKTLENLFNLDIKEIIHFHLFKFNRIIFFFSENDYYKNHFWCSICNTDWYEDTLDDEEFCKYCISLDKTK